MAVNDHDRVAVRLMTAGDRRAVLALVRELQAHESTVYDRMIPPDAIDDTYLDHVDEDCRRYDGLVLVALKRERIVGYATIMRRAFDESYDEVPFTYGYIGDLCVAPDQRGGGIGRALIEACEAEARAAGQRWLRISVLARNQAAHALYRAAGFHDHLVTLEKPLEDHA